MLRIVLLVFIILLNGCTTVDVSSLEDGNRILIVSTIGDTYNVIYVGTTVFTNKSKIIDVSDWNIDNFVASELEKIISKSRFQPVVLSDKYEAPAISIEPWTNEIDFNGNINKYKKLAKSFNADTILFLFPLEYGDPFYGTNQRIAGYGYYQKPYSFGVNAVNYSRILARFVDAKSLKQVAASHSSLFIKTNVEFKEDEIDFSKNDADGSKHRIEKLIKDSLNNLMRRMKVSTE